MPQRDNLNIIKSSSRSELKQVRLEGLTKPFEQLTIGELTQLRPGGANADSYEVNAVTDNVSVTTSALLHKLGEAKAVEIMKSEQGIRAKQLKLKPSTIIHEEE